jgi:hypothetical protein
MISKFCPKCGKALCVCFSLVVATNEAEIAERRTIKRRLQRGYAAAAAYQFDGIV